jgi:hypothetical protein
LLLFVEYDFWIFFLRRKWSGNCVSDSHIVLPRHGDQSFKDHRSVHSWTPLRAEKNNISQQTQIVASSVETQSGVRC